eukprot:Blabericola_migrator_1__6501@NODE_327_length_9735_cov_125_899772_g264_i0_p5_GENE_NODE_327_length_9735_cov_125_899772_g264_i0NODE_327_length_9735_cov_125_899772_g264_i0_p5_ORF_typecomplete_len197_score15_00CAF1_p60_C/PF15512_6/0_025_NODE_327_length_9735_cov_125_899772_g264_i081671
MRFLVRDPDILNRVWSIDLPYDMDAPTLTDLIKAFIAKRNGGAVLPSACQLKFRVGQTLLTNDMDIGWIGKDKTIDTNWDASSLVPCSMNCPNCLFLSGRHRTTKPPPPRQYTLRMPEGTSRPSPTRTLHSPISPLTPPADYMPAVPSSRAVSLDSTPADLVPKLERLVNLYQEGYLNDLEFDRAKYILFNGGMFN